MPRRVPTYRPPHLANAKPAARSAYERGISRRADRDFYKSPPWRGTRACKLRLNPCCEDCERRGLVVVATQVHHKIDRKERPDLALDLDNLESLCAACHGAKRRRDDD
jgi:5-methylcytosine-specific restriction endonuclease McrA